MPVREVEIEICDRKLTLRRSAANLKAISRRFGSASMTAMFTGKVEDQLTSVYETVMIFAGWRPDTTAPPLISIDEFDDKIDSVKDILSIVQKIQDLMMGDQEPVASTSISLAPFVPTPEPLVERMLDVAGLKEGDLFIDPCCGDGRTLAAAEKRGARPRGYEIDKDRYEKSNSAIAGGEVFNEDGAGAQFKDADVIFLYTLPASNVKLQPLLLAQCKDTCRIVSHAFSMPGWTPYQEEVFQGSTFYAWLMSDVRKELAEPLASKAAA